MGSTTAEYRWFAVFYALMMFFVVPLTVFALSMAGTVVLSVVVAVLLLLASAVIVINALQRSRPLWLPVRLRSWDFLPLCLRSLDPADRIVSAVMAFCRATCCCCRRCHEDQEKDDDKRTKDARLLGDLAVGGGSLNSSEEEQRDATLPDDVCEIIITELDSNSEKVAKEFALTLSKRLAADDIESGYGSAICTPAPSRLASYGQLPQVPDLCVPAAPSRLPSYGRLELIIETEAAAALDTDTQNCGDNTS